MNVNPTLSRLEAAERRRAAARKGAETRRARRAAVEAAREVERRWGRHSDERNATAERAIGDERRRQLSFRYVGHADDGTPGYWTHQPTGRRLPEALQLICNQICAAPGDAETICALYDLASELGYLREDRP